MMRTIWTDVDGSDLSLSDCDEVGDETGEFLYLRAGDSESVLFSFEAADAESFAAVLLAWAKRQREGV